jgi:hypothetical protein
MSFCCAFSAQRMILIIATVGPGKHRQQLIAGMVVMDWKLEGQGMGTTDFC